MQRAQRYLFGQVYDRRTPDQKYPTNPGEKGEKGEKGGKQPKLSGSSMFSQSRQNVNKNSSNINQTLVAHNNMYFGAQQRRIRNSIFASVILGELCQELAAFAEQHAILALKMK